MASINRAELAQVTDFLRGVAEVPSIELLTKLELGLWIFYPFSLGFEGGVSAGYLVQESRDTRPLLLAGRFGPAESSRILWMFRERVIPYLLVRVQSWEVHINCNGEVLTKHCEEDLDAVREACEELRSRCREKRPSVADRSAPPG
jgi:hypothetical protein